MKNATTTTTGQYVRKQLVAVTATGPIYRQNAKLLVAPMPIGLAYIQELGKRTIHPKSKVISSIADRLSGDSARKAWLKTCGMATGGLIYASPRTRLVYLGEVLRYVKQQGNTNALEPVIGAALNAAWPWIETSKLG